MTLCVFFMNDKDLTIQTITSKLYNSRLKSLYLNSLLFDFNNWKFRIKVIHILYGEEVSFKEDILKLFELESIVESRSVELEIFEKYKLRPTGFYIISLFYSYKTVFLQKAFKILFSLFYINPEFNVFRFYFIVSRHALLKNCLNYFSFL